MNSLLVFSFLWARVALGFYLAGLIAAILAARVRRERQDVAFALARAAVATGFLFQFVSLVETAAALPLGPATFYRIVSGLLAIIIAAFFLMVCRATSPRAISLLVVPLLCLLTAASILEPAGMHGGPSPLAQSLMRNGWIYLHIVLIFMGYAGLVLAMGSGVLYLVAERRLKSKHARLAGELLPSLETLDLIGYRSLLAGFPLLTAGLAIGAYWADALFGRVALSDPTVLLALLAWALYLVLLFARWSAGWRGRRSAYLTVVCFALALAGWLANGLSFMHSVLLR
ncbi:MAG: cytochrome c biogenesis protein CcsA [Terriglobales bacterium]